MYQFLWIFFIYAFLGWCTEVSYAALNTEKFVNRGFLNGFLSVAVLGHSLCLCLSRCLGELGLDFGGLGLHIGPVSYTHLTLPTNNRV